MNILLVGNAGNFMRLMINRLNKEGHRVFVLTEEPKKGYSLKKVFEVYHFSYEDACVREVLESIMPQVVVFLGAYDHNFSWNRVENTAASYAAGLTNILMNYTALKKGRFVYLSSESVFGGGSAQFMTEDDPTGAYSKKGQAIAIGEDICKNYARMGNDVVILRLDHLYGEIRKKEDTDTICADMCLEAVQTGEIIASQNEKIMLLHEADAVEFIYQIMVAKDHKHTLYQLSSGEKMSRYELAQAVAAGMENEVSIVEEENKKYREVMLSGKRYDEEFGSRVLHHAGTDVEKIAAYFSRHVSEFTDAGQKKGHLFRRLGSRTKEIITNLIPFMENLICFIPFFMLNNRAVGSEYFQNIDFYLLYVLLFALVYGQQQATFSALLAVAGYCFRQMYHRSGFDVMLDYNTYVWIAQLLILGLAVGYLRDQLRAMREEQRHEVSYLTKQLDDISDINVSNVRVKEILANQIVNQNDSFGKLYEITSSLEQYEPCEVLFYAAEVLAKLMGSKDVAIYTVANRSYARLFSATSEKARSLGNSINYSEMDAMYTVLAGKKVYINKNMDERYPLMANAIYSEDEMQLILMIWGIPWERMTLGQANMLTVIGYLIQNAVVRANRYISALEQQRYIKGTNILEPETFLALVKAYLNARDKGLTQCALLSVDTKENDRDEVGKRLIKLLRQSDYVGELEGGKMYARLANTSAKDATMVKERFEKEGVSCQIQEDVFV